MLTFALALMFVLSGTLEGSRRSMWWRHHICHYLWKYLMVDWMILLAYPSEEFQETLIFRSLGLCLRPPKPSVLTPYDCSDTSFQVRLKFRCQYVSLEICNSL